MSKWYERLWWKFRHPFLGYRTKRDARRVGCVEETIHRKERRHRACDDCGELTCARMMRVDPVSLRRQMRPVCRFCCDYVSDDATRRLRTETDWERPIPDQFPGVTRRTIKAFLDSGEMEIILGDDTSIISTINQSLGTLGFADTCYAEERSNLAVLRRVPC